MQIPRAEHIGSLKRPDALLQKRLAFKQGNCTVEDLRALEDACVAAIVQMQRDLGYDVFTDGEFRRSVFLPSSRPMLSSLICLQRDLL